MPETALTKSNVCPNVPRKGIFAGKPCLRPEGAGHPGACVYDPEKLAATIASEESGRPIKMTDDEIIRAFTEDEIRQRSAELEDAQTVWERVRDKAMPKILCPQCNGNGRVTGGTLGEFCDACNGSRVVQDITKPFDFAMPDFAELRGPIARYANAHALRAHGVRAELPDKSTVASLEEIRALTAAAQQRALELGPGQMPPLPRSLAAGHAGESTGYDDTATDAELVEQENGGEG